MDSSAAFKPIDESLKFSAIDGTVLLATVFSKILPLFLNEYAVVDSFVPLLIDLSLFARSSLAKLIEVVNELCDEDECQVLWRACVGALAERGIKENYGVLVGSGGQLKTGKEYREILVYLLTNRRVQRHIYRWSRYGKLFPLLFLEFFSNLVLLSNRFPLILEHLFTVSDPSRTEVGLLFPHPWWPNSTEPFSSVSAMRKSVNNLSDYYGAVNRILLSFTRSMLGDTEPLDPRSDAISIDQKILAGLGKGSLSNWLDLSKTTWNSFVLFFFFFFFFFFFATHGSGRANSASGIDYEPNRSVENQPKLFLS